MQTTEAAAAASKLAPTEGKNSNKALRIYETTLRVVECCHIRQLLSLRSKLSRKVEPFHARSSLRSHSPLSFLASRSPGRGNTEILARCAQKNCPTMGDIMHHFFFDERTRQETLIKHLARHPRLAKEAMIFTSRAAARSCRGLGSSPSSW